MRFEGFLKPAHVEKFSFAADDGHKVVATQCLKCGTHIRVVVVERTNPPSPLYHVTLACHGEAETADRAYVEVGQWVGKGATR